MDSQHSAAYKAMLLRLIAVRHARRLTQQQVADRLGIPRVRVTKIETGERRLDVIELEAFAVLYRKPLRYFVPRRAP